MMTPWSINKMCIRDRGMELVWEQVDFDSIIPGIQAGRYDAGVAGISITADRLKNCDFSDPYFLANQVIVVNPGSDIQSKADLTGKTIAVQTGTTAAVSYTHLDVYKRQSRICTGR